jgi:hypothetical protein
MCADGQLKVPSVEESLALAEQAALELPDGTKQEQALKTAQLKKAVLDKFLEAVQWPADWEWDSSTTKSARMALANAAYVDTLRGLVEARAAEVGRQDATACEEVLALYHSEPAKEEMRNHHPETLVSFGVGRECMCAGRPGGRR